LDDVELGLPCGDVGQLFGDDVLFGLEQVVAVAGGGYDGHAGGLGEDADVGGVDLLDVEEGGGLGDEVGRAELGDVVDDAVGRQDGDAGGLHVDEGHHHGRFGEGRDGKMAGAELGVLVHGRVGLVEGKLELRRTLLGVGDG